MSEHSVTKFQVTKAKVHFMDDFAANFMTKCLLKVQTSYQINMVSTHMYIYMYAI